MVKLVSTVQATQKGKKNSDAKIVYHPINHDLKVIQEITKWVKEWVKAVTKQFADFKANITEFTMSS